MCDNPDRSWERSSSGERRGSTMTRKKIGWRGDSQRELGNSLSSRGQQGIAPEKGKGDRQQRPRWRLQGESRGSKG